jgi:hypothetical protein
MKFYIKVLFPITGYEVFQRVECMRIWTMDKFNKINIGAERIAPIPVAVRPKA